MRKTLDATSHRDRPACKCFPANLGRSTNLHVTVFHGHESSFVGKVVTTKARVFERRQPPLLEHLG